MTLEVEGDIGQMQLYKDGRIMDIAKAADQLNISVLGQTVTKHFLCYPKDCII